MQVPANTTGAIGAEIASSSASPGPLGSLSGAASTKEGRLPAFAAVFAQQSVSADAGKGDAPMNPVISGSTDEQPEAASAMSAKVPGKVQFNQLSDTGVKPGAAQDNANVLESAPSKGEAKTQRHRAIAAKLMSETRKNHDALVTDVTSAVLPPTTTQVAPESTSSKLPDVVIGIPPQSPAPTTAHRRSVQVQVQKDELPLQSFPSVNVKDDRPVTTVPLPVDSMKDSSSVLQFHASRSQVPSLSAISEANELKAVNPGNGPSVHRSSSETDSLGFYSARDLNKEEGTLTSTVPQGVSQQVFTTSVSKSKSQEKSTAEVVRGVTSSGAVLSGSSTQIVPSHGGVSAISQSARPDDIVEAHQKQGLTMGDTNTFERLDSGPAQPTLLHSSAHEVAVGVHDPLLGWVEVQTQSSAGHISATLTIGSTEAHASLAAQAPAITQYLADRDVTIHNLHVHAQADSQAGASGGGSSQSGSENNSYSTPERDNTTGKSLSLLPIETPTQSISQHEGAAYISVRA